MKNDPLYLIKKGFFENYWAIIPLFGALVLAYFGDDFFRRDERKEM